MIAIDKLHHLVYCYTIAITVAFCLSFINTDLMLLGSLAGIIAGISKELFDKYIKHKVFDKKDLWASIWGSVLGGIVPYFIYAIFG
jgi:uncharacterized membrane protein YvlD (DUF360 family)